MDFFENLIGKAKDVAGIAGKKTNEIVEVSKIKLDVIQINQNIEKMYQRLGEYVYNCAKAHIDGTDIIANYISQIDGLMMERENLNEKLGEIKNMIKCPVCGVQCPEDANFCLNCGHHFDQEPQKAEEGQTETDGNSDSALLKNGNE